jgi:hypothetical protein
MKSQSNREEVKSFMVSPVQLNETNDGLTRDGKPFFYFADTVWSVFSNAAVEEWKEYLEYRRLQNFNAVQISILPVLHDASGTYTGLSPFHPDEQGQWDFHRIHDAFFDQAEQMVDMACQMGFVPVLVILWNNYVPGTWANSQVPEYSMPKDAVRPYTEYVARRFAPYHPIYFVSGDTKFENEEIVDYFMISLTALKALSPHALAAMHVIGQFHELPQRIIESEHLDLYIYQAGHVLESQQDNYLLAEQFLNKPIKRPIINSEPPYEGHGHGNRYGRFEAFDIRKAFWQSVLSGAKAGFAYGAHGVWGWHKEGADFTSESWSKMPFDWRYALRMPGAWDASYSQWLYTSHRLAKLNPANELLLSEYEDIRMAADPDHALIAIYVPYSQDVKLKVHWGEYHFIMIDLTSRNVLQPTVLAVEEHTLLRKCPFNTDVLIIGIKKKTKV